MHEVVDLLANGLELMDIFLGYRIEVVVDMLAYRFQHTAQAVDELLVGVGAEVEPSIALDSNVLWRFLQSEHFLTAVFLQVVLLLVE